MSGAKQYVYLINRCFDSNDCTHVFSTPRKLRNYLRDGYGYVFPARLKLTHRYNNNKKTPVIAASNLNDLSDHFRTVHYDYLPPQRQQCIQDDLDGKSANVECHGNDTSQNSMDNSPSTKQKRLCDEGLSVGDIIFLHPGSDRLVIDSFDLAQAFFNLQTYLKQEK
ncbi:hypothetical protein J3Q64DRAFT_1703128 [Phycomyces blakesleeanus]|uniref:C2H2-type zinc finger transcription factor n=2 Tax=Phycomyces blakesleeanus TaxID=4837 RepID=A0A162NB97_PHYB8|nr:hypothetical protein PHYBLDRAFT_151455 [Phycomyces blakesleeanus NRRL 1555(-)]OAD67554.1 hypothetical protein PHYBLDRAFT_151455 [Phycomyces blakesleeanus NRRL 1555(-)]|eukprot:XP_018285594.1 hypothetical protein PHYBLDRAFT_151455 [Phycomyces blakesleeanus NRRL 1555(-)]